MFPDVAQIDTGGHASDSYPPCAGESPVNLEELHPMVRDCSRPNLSHIDASEPWFVRDAHVPPPITDDAPKLDPAKVLADRASDLHRSRRNAILATATASTLLAGSLAAFVEFHKYAARVDYDRHHVLTVSPERAANDESHRSPWELATIGLATGAAVTGILSGQLWRHASALQIQATGEKTWVSYAGRF